MASTLGRDIAAATLAAAGIGVATWGGLKLYQRAQLASTVAGLALTVSGGPFVVGGVATGLQVKATWTNSSTAQQGYGVQGAVLVGGVVAGHLWVSAGAAASATATYNSGNQGQAAALAASPAQRVLLLAVGPQQGASATLYGDPIIQAGETLVVWVAPNPPTGALLMADPQGTLGSRLAPAGASQATATLQAAAQQVRGAGLGAWALRVAGTGVHVRKVG